MMSARRFLLPCLTVACALLAAACLPWGVATPQAVARVDRELRAAYGVGLAAAGDTAFTLLPWPRLTFREVALSAQERPLAASDALSVHLALLPLLVGRAEATELVLDGAQVTLAAGPGDDRWGLPLRRLMRQAAEGMPSASLKRVILRGSTFTAYDPRTGAPEIARAVTLTASWPRRSATLDLSGSLAWHGRPVNFSLSGIRPAEAIAGAATPFEATVSWPFGSLALDGTGAIEARPILKGSARLTTTSLGETLAWLGADVALAPLVGALGIEATFAAAKDGFVLPSLRVTAGSNVLDGAGGLSQTNGRLAVTATLAADALDLAPVLPTLQRTLEGETGWSRAPLVLARFTGCDLDLRLSAGSAVLGGLRLEDMAAGLQVKETGIEATVGRATLGDGTVKGRLSLATAPQGAELRIAGSLDRVDAGAVLVDLGAHRWVVGTAQGQLSLEGAGASVDEIARHLGGRMALSMRDGEISGINLADTLDRAGTASEAAHPAGRTPFERAELVATFSEGTGMVSGASLRSPGLQARVDGQISVPERSLAGRAELESEGPRPGAAFAIAGPWMRPRARAVGTVRPAGPSAFAPSGASLPPKASAYAQ